MLNCFFVGLGGFIGSVCRYLIGLIPLSAATAFPWKTLLINVIGSLLLGMISAVAARQSEIPSCIVLMLKVGVCGGFTTFSAFVFESATLCDDGKAVFAVVYITLSVILGVTAIIFGQRLFE